MMATTSYARDEQLVTQSTRPMDATLRSTLGIAIRYTLVTTVLLGIVYPLVVTGIAQLTMRGKADGSLIVRNGQVIGSELIGQGFSSTRYFHSRPSAAGNGWDATNSGGSNLGPTSQALVTRVDGDVASWHKQDPKAQGPVPIDLVTTSASGLDPDISPADALYQLPMVAAARHLPEATVRALVESHIQGRQLGFLGEPRVNVLELNLALDALQNK
ncbi:MAG TPA: potassium-transporting ATPase subunit KdpC [Acidobacteriaceae bacterium]|jgi:K+-transporting ATPase ATPase C chain|nr:potassium-transporting ATPase subunit KdpC [Acidobacteriaceae bacterium]